MTPYWFGIHQGGPKIKDAIKLGSNIVTTVFALLFMGFEVHRITSLEPALSNYLYLALLASTMALIGGWLLVSQKEIDILAVWLDPTEDYIEPNEHYRAIGFAVVLLILLFAARSILFFGIAYVIYSIGNLAGWHHLREATKGALARCRRQLQTEPNLEKRTLISGALGFIEYYYLKRPHMLRAEIQLAFAIIGCTLAIFGRFRPSQLTAIMTYAVFILTILIIEIYVITWWRFEFYSSMETASRDKRRLEREVRDKHYQDKFGDKS